MFGFFNGGEANDDAVSLKKFTDMSLNKYSTLPRKELAVAITHNFDEKHRYIGAHQINFVFAELVEFQKQGVKSNQGK